MKSTPNPTARGARISRRAPGYRPLACRTLRWHGPNEPERIDRKRCATSSGQSRQIVPAGACRRCAGHVSCPCSSGRGPARRDLADAGRTDQADHDRPTASSGLARPSASSLVRGLKRVSVSLRPEGMPPAVTTGATARAVSLPLSSRWPMPGNWYGGREFDRVGALSCIVCSPVLRCARVASSLASHHGTAHRGLAYWRCSWASRPKAWSPIVGLRHHPTVALSRLLRQLAGSS